MKVINHMSPADIRNLGDFLIIGVIDSEHDLVNVLFEKTRAGITLKFKSDAYVRKGKNARKTGLGELRHLPEYQGEALFKNEEELCRFLRDWNFHIK